MDAHTYVEEDELDDEEETVDNIPHQSRKNSEEVSY